MGALQSCRLCRGERVEHHFTARGHRIVRCPDCDFTQTAQVPAGPDIRESYGRGYFENSKYRDRKAQLRENSRRLGLVKRLTGSPRARVLEAGCGTGEFLRLAKREFEVCGFDLSEAAVKAARSANRDLNGRIWQGSVDEVDLPREGFDAVCLWDVVEHLPDPLSSCEKLMGALRPGGHLLLSTPAIDAPLARVLGRWWPFMTPPEHLGFFSSRSLGHLFEKTLGGRIVEDRRMGKWVNGGFLLYKIRRVAAAGLSREGLPFSGPGLLGKLSIYVPSGDVRYAAVRKPGD